jgi:phosphoenolpyruvate carboxylase
VNLAGWFGLGSGLAAASIRELRAMHREWPFFTSLIENAELSLAKADLPIAQLYLELGEDPSIAKPIEDELALTTERVLAITRRDRPLDGRPILRRAIDLRNPYVDALSFLQLRLLRETHSPKADPELDRLVQITVNGVAAGLQNTG